MTRRGWSGCRATWPVRRSQHSPTAPHQAGAEPARQTVVVVETTPTGHRLKYVELVIAAALSRGSVVHFLTTPEVTGSPEYSLHLSARASTIVLTESDRLDVAAIRAYAVLHGPCHVVAPTADHLAIQLGLGRGWPTGPSLSLLVLRDPTAEPGATMTRRAKLLLKSAVLRRTSRMAGVSVYRLRSAGRELPAGDGPFIKDPVVVTSTPSSVDSLRRDWMLDDGRFWFGVIGAITKRKNLDLICRVLADVDGHVGLLVAGKVSADAQPSEQTVQELNGRGIRVKQVPRILTDVEIDSAVAAVDCVLLLHSNEGPSGILGKAAAIGTRILAGGAQSLKDDLTALDTGSWVPLEPVALRRALATVMSLPAPVPVMQPSTASFDQLIYPHPSSLRSGG